MADFKSHLKRQLSFIKRSCDSFDKGYTDEAIRIAVVIRVLLHQTKHSTSLLTHMQAEDIKLLSSDGTDHPGAIMYQGLVSTTFSNGEITHQPNLGNFPHSHKFLTVSEWMNQTVIVLDSKKITRKKLILSAANQDGGAHVDSKIDHIYNQLSQDGAYFKKVYLRNGVYLLSADQPGEVHFMSLRQLGYEILNSQEIIALTK
ncbi:hypothetical protein PJX95_11800 [Serratia rubidaea]|uniref:hypothetical protein n=1 Tax=Serratia rubidaea TaxID=61652 RepID=UPI00234B9EF4|nr:hypothetical protein [Serratia rubidaea]MDC6118736.1 hypothetical protein [Serratia rubidaea]